MAIPAESTSPADPLSADHRELDVLLLQVQQMLEGVEDAALYVAIDRLWMRLAVHIRAEHKELFPALSGLESGLQGAIQGLKVDHDAFMTGLSSALQALRSPAPDRALVRELMDAVRQRLAEHNRIEESQVYPLADGLPADRRAKLLQGLVRELSALPGRYRHD